MKLKKILSAAMSLTLVCGAVTAVNSYVPGFAIMASAADEDCTEVTEGYLTYNVYSGHAEVSGCDTEATGEIEIPAEINGVTVTSIGSGAFYGCTSLEKIVISEGVTTIGRAAFYSCSSLESIIIPDSVTSVEVYTFYCCTSLESITIPDSVTSIGEAAFYACTNLETIIIPDSVKSIDGIAFSGCTALESITILNPDCKIEGGAVTICNGYNAETESIYFTGTICGCSNSTAQEYAEKCGYNFEALGDAPKTDILYGDANLDGKVSAADAVAILQSIGNSDKYALSAEGKAAADVDGVPGITPKDALVIQQVSAGIYQQSDLPLKA